MRLLLLGIVVAAAGCTAERDCRAGLEQLEPRVEGAIGTGAYPEAVEQINQAYTGMTAAKESAAQGDFAACVRKVEEARVLLNKSQRTN